MHAVLTQYLLLRSACRYADQRLYFGKAHLYRSHIRFSGWTRGGRYNRRISLSDVREVGWYSPPGGAPKLMLKLRDGQWKAFGVEGAALWRLRIDGLLAEARRRERIQPYRHQVLYASASASPAGGDGAAVSSAASAD